MNKKNNISPLENLEKDIATAKKEIANVTNRVNKTLNQKMKMLTLEKIITSLNSAKFEWTNRNEYTYKGEHFSVDILYDEGFKFYSLYVNIHEMPDKDIYL